MKDILITVKNKIAMNLGNATYICDNSDYRVSFDFDEEWDEHPVKTARFKYNDQYQEVVFTGNECPVPLIRDARLIYVGVYAGNLQTSTPAVIHASQSILSGDAVHTEPAEDVYHQLVELVESGVLKGPDGKSAYQLAVENGYIGSETDWLASLHGAPGKTPEYGVDYGTQEQIDDIAKQAAEVLADDIKNISDGKVDKVEGKGLSTNDYDNSAKAKVDAIPEDPKYTDTVYDDKAVKIDINQIKDDLSAEQTAREQADTSVQKEISAKLPKSPADWEPWTKAEQAAARERMGIPGDYELIDQIALTDVVSEIIRDTDTNNNQYSLKNLLLFVSAGKTTLKMSIRIEINGKYIIDTERIGDNVYAYNNVCRFDINNGILSTFLIGNRGSLCNRVIVYSSIVGMSAIFDTINSVKLKLTNPIEGATIKIYGVRA